jgi:hypothetical protein
MRWRGPAVVNDIPIIWAERMLYKDYNCKCSVEEKILVVGLKRLGAKKN